MNQPFRTLSRFTVVATSVAIIIASRAAAQDNVVQAQIPDFYQHQGDNGGGGPTSNSPSADPIWSPDRGWCAYVSDMDALYPWENLTVLGAKPYDNASQWLFGNPGAAANPGTGTALTGAGTWVGAADDTVIPALVGTPAGVNGTINSYLAAQKVDPASLGLAGLVDTQYRVQAGGQVQVATIAGWQNVISNTFQTYQQLTSAGSNLAAGLQPLGAITTTIRLNYTPGNGQGTTNFWWGFHQVAGAGTAGANTIQYSDPDAIPINAGNRNGGFTQAAVNANQYTAAQQAGASPLPGNGAYNAGNLYSTMVIDANGNVTGGNGPYAAGLKPGGVAPVSRIVGFDAVGLPAVQLVNNAAQAGYNLLKLAFTGDFGGDISKLEIFTNSQLANAANNFGLSETDPNWNISTVTQDPFGNLWGPGYAGIELQEGAGGQDLMEGASEGEASSYLATLDTTGAVTGWTVYAYDQASGNWLTETYGATAGFGNANQLTAIPEPSAYAGLLGLATLAFALIRSRRQIF
jgi:hypothetical protein